MKILMASSEMAPLARTGGLGDVIEALPAELTRRGHEVSVAIPYYRCIREDKAVKVTSTGVQIAVQVGSKRVEADVLECEAPNGVQVFLVRRDEYFDRSGLYSGDRAYDDNAERFIFFSKAVIELARRIRPAPDILHAHDWPTALIPALVRSEALPFQTVLTIHNIAHQGSFWAADFGLTNLPGDYFSARGVEFFGALNFLKGGVVYADAITTVSEQYAREIQTPEFGCGLDAVMREHAGRLRGILDGADYSAWDPATDKRIAKKYTASSLGGKKSCRNALLKQFGLDPKPIGPIFAMVTRLAEQKGIDLILPLLDRLLSTDTRLVIIGEGETKYERELLIASKKHRGRFVFQRGFEDKVAHVILAGADAVLMRSHFEPCGLAAMYALRYGSIPVARAVGGLHQILQDFDPTTGAGNAFLFYDYAPEALWDAIGRARKMFHEPEAWTGLMQRAMECDFSWASGAAEYEKLYAHLLEGRPARR